MCERENQIDEQDVKIWISALKNGKQTEHGERLLEGGKKRPCTLVPPGCVKGSESEITPKWGAHYVSADRVWKNEQESHSVGHYTHKGRHPSRVIFG